MRIVIKWPMNLWWTHWTNGRRLVRIGPYVIDARPGTKRLSIRRVSDD